LCNAILAFFLDSLEKSLAFVREKTIKATTRIDVMQKAGRVDYLRFDKGRIKGKMKWLALMSTSLTLTLTLTGTRLASDVNLLVLSDSLRDCYSNHLRLRKHLYLDRTI
jgi:hypothetical protein